MAMEFTDETWENLKSLLLSDDAESNKVGLLQIRHFPNALSATECVSKVEETEDCKLISKWELSYKLDGGNDEYISILLTITNVTKEDNGLFVYAEFFLALYNNYQVYPMIAAQWITLRLENVRREIYEAADAVRLTRLETITQLLHSVAELGA